MAQPLVKKCIDCGNGMAHSKHHFRCNKCWFKQKEKIMTMKVNYKTKLKPLRI